MVTICGKDYQKLTTMERNRAYRHAFTVFLTHMAGPYLCNVLKAYLRDKHGYKFEFTVESKEICPLFFPEMREYLPTDGTIWPVNDAWNAHRADVLAQCIEETNAI